LTVGTDERLGSRIVGVGPVTAATGKRADEAQAAEAAKRRTAEIQRWTKRRDGLDWVMTIETGKTAYGPRQEARIGAVFWRGGPSWPLG
jgi:hypothetical protein